MHGGGQGFESPRLHSGNSCKRRENNRPWCDGRELSAATVLDAFAVLPERKALIAQVATDVKSGTLGILNLCTPDLQLEPSEIDQNAGRTISSNSELELYHELWQESLDEHELIPTRGCSVPTFHGSAADLAAVAATLASLLGNHLRQTGTALSGTHLIALPHADSGPRHYFLPV